MKRIQFVLLVFTLCTPGASRLEAREYRNILSGSYIDYDGIGISRTWENTLVVRWNSRVSTLARLYRDDRTSWDNTVGTGGVVYALTRSEYIEAAFGYGSDSDSRDSRHFSLELTREKPGYLLGAGLRRSVYPGFSVTVLSPGMRWYFTPDFSWWGKYFASRDSHGHYDQAYWTELQHTILKRVILAAGITGGNRLYSPEYESQLGGDASGRFHSWLVRASWVVSERTALKLQYDQLTRDGGKTDRRNMLLLDARF